jgi:nitroreductase
VKAPVEPTVSAAVAPILLQRRSRRALAPQPISAELVSSLFEAARWAPSAANLQPWLFVYANDSEALARVRPIIKDDNRRWADRAPLLVFLFARRNHPETGRPLRSAAFDTGAAWISLALQCEHLGLSARAIGGIHHEAAHEILSVPAADFESIVGIAIGYPGLLAELPPDLAATEGISERKAQSEFAFNGRYRRP